VCTGNENSKPIWNKFIIRKDIIETSQVVLNFCRTVYLLFYIQFYLTLSNIVSEWLLFNDNSAISQLNHGENKLIVNEMMVSFALY
jgi:hypothetical protein